jgi:hypothetical protein
MRTNYVVTDGDAAGFIALHSRLFVAPDIPRAFAHLEGSDAYAFLELE